jgi:hypothetical protein
MGNADPPVKSLLPGSMAVDIPKTPPIVAIYGFAK